VRASFTMSIIFLWYRCLLSAVEIGELLGVEQSRVIQAAKDIREYGFFERTSQCGSGPIRNQYGLSERLM
jgi:hypothetical protein